MRRVVPWMAATRPALVAAMAFAAGCSLVPADGGRLRIEEVERALLPMASVAVDTGQLETAGRLYQRLLEVDPESFEAHMGLGDVAFKGRRSDEAARWYLGALTVSAQPDERHEALLWHGRAALEAGRLAESRRSFQQLTEAREQAPARSVAWAFNGVGLTRLLEGDLPAAVAAMRWAVRHAPNEPMFAENLDRALAMLGEQQRRPPRHAGRRVAERPRTVAQTTPPTVDELVPETPRAMPEQPSTPAEQAPPPQPVPAPPPAAFPVPRPAPTMVTPPASSTRDETPEGALAADVPAVPPALPAPPAPTPDATTGGPLDRVGAPAAPAVEWLDEQAAAAARPPPPAAVRPATASVVRVGGQAFVQVGAFERFAAADAASKQLADVTGAHALVALSRSLYRVRIGPLASQVALDAVTRALAGNGYVVQDALPAPRADVSEETRVAQPGVDAAAMPDGAGEETHVAWQNVAGDALAAIAETTPPAATTGLVVEEGGQRFVQLGAFATREKARELASRVRELTTAPVQIDAVQRRGETLHRVRVGPLETEAAFAELTAATKAAGYAIE